MVVELKRKLTAVGIALQVLLAITGALALTSGTSNTALHATTSSEISQAMDKADAEFKRAFLAVREADAAGADKEKMAILVERLNSVLGMIDEAERLRVEGEIEEASAMAGRTIDISKGIVSEAIELRDEASRGTYYGKAFAFGMAPVASLIVTVGSICGWKWWRRYQIDRIMRMEIKRIKEPEEEK